MELFAQNAFLDIVEIFFGSGMHRNQNFETRKLPMSFQVRLFVLF